MFPFREFSLALPAHSPRFTTHTSFTPLSQKGFLVAVISFIVAQIFFYTFQMTIDTILLCFCEDCYQNDGTPEKNKVLHNVIASNAEHAAVSASIIYLNSKQEQREYDMLIKVDKWTLKDLKKAVENIGEHNKAPAMSDHEEVRVDDEFLSLSLFADFSASPSFLLPIPHSLPPSSLCLSLALPYHAL